MAKRNPERKRILRKASRDSLLILSVFAIALYLVLNPTITQWLEAERVAQSAGMGDYVTPISGWRGTAWLFGLVLVFMVLHLVVTRLLLSRYWKQYLEKSTDRLRADFARTAQESHIPAMRLTPVEFEYEVARVISAVTGLEARRVGRQGDGGVDITVYRDNRLVGIVQCKRYDPGKALPPAYIRELYAVKAKYAVTVAYLVTTSYFSSDAEAEAKRLNIRLMDGEQFEAARSRLPNVTAKPRPAPMVRDMWADG